MVTAGVETLAAKLHELTPHNYGRKTAEQLVRLAQQSTSSGLATSARSSSLKILCDQLEHTQTNVVHPRACLRIADQYPWQSLPQIEIAMGISYNL